MTWRQLPEMLSLALMLGCLGQQSAPAQQEAPPAESATGAPGSESGPQQPQPAGAQPSANPQDEPTDRREDRRRRGRSEDLDDRSPDDRRRRANPLLFRPKDPPGLTRIAQDYDVWVDLKRNHVVVDGAVSLRQGPLEMFACPTGTKEHESIVAVNCPARFVHAGLLAVGAKPGSPVKFDPEYVPAMGPVIEIWILWIDQDGQRRKARAKNWVRDMRTGEPMEFDWVFGGSGFWKDEETGEEHYMGDGGDLICVSNFTTATLDLTIESSSSTGGLLFEALTENIPNLDTHVRLVLIPQLGP